ncbi:MAG: SoxR reducing system RseC family protein [Fervidobacterium sp.]|nr:SoxR reducing system RseC family protein [Fervidobacterium sp.]
MREVMKVSNVDDRYIYLSLSVSETTCSTCAIAGSCSIKESGKELRILKNSVRKEFLPLAPGDIVVVDMKYNQAVLSLIVYGIPLLGFIVGILLGYFLKLSDIASFIIGILLAGGSTVVSRTFDKKYKIDILDVKHQNLTKDLISEYTEN